MDNVSFDRRVLYLFFLYPLILLNRFGCDSLRDFRGVIGLNVSCGSGDGSPSFATTDAAEDGGEDGCAKQHHFQ
jgi:hypothetical protein